VAAIAGICDAAIAPGERPSVGKARSLIVLAANASSATFARSGAFMVQRVATLASEASRPALSMFNRPHPAMTKHGPLKRISGAPVSSQRRY
jgi:hypothetical protein